jgi:hypothetical protein
MISFFVAEVVMSLMIMACGQNVNMSVNDMVLADAVIYVAFA